MICTNEIQLRKDGSTLQCSKEVVDVRLAALVLTEALGCLGILKTSAIPLVSSGHLAPFASLRPTVSWLPWPQLSLGIVYDIFNKTIHYLKHKYNRKNLFLKASIMSSSVFMKFVISRFFETHLQKRLIKENWF